ncbi:hypothetical protein MP228_004580 [Amoeboaphelidium protococcarum]|nr:hypothetical protein MP228_004580 [Amoeboaphelidium protococcarum]
MDEDMINAVLRSLPSEESGHQRRRYPMQQRQKQRQQRQERPRPRNASQQSRSLHIGYIISSPQRLNREGMEIKYLNSDFVRPSLPGAGNSDTLISLMLAYVKYAHQIESEENRKPGERKGYPGEQTGLQSRGYGRRA